MDIIKKINEVIDTLADMHDAETDKNYPIEKCLACMCQEDLQDIIDYITQQRLSNIETSDSRRRCRPL